MVETVFDDTVLLVLLLFTLGVSLCSCLKTGLLLLFRLGTILVQQLVQLGGGILVECVGELGECWGYFETLVEDDFLALETDVCGPFDEAS